MGRFYFVLLPIILFPIISIAQTKLISHKSHSGSSDTFAISFHEDLFNMSESNLGVPSLQTHLDSIIYISEDEVLLVSTSYYFNKNENIPQKDTIHNNALLSKKHSLDSIKKKLKDPEIYRAILNYQNDIDSVVFVGYDNNLKLYRKDAKKKFKEEKKKEKRLQILLINKNDQNGNLPNLFATIGIIAVLSLLITYVKMRYMSISELFK